MRTQPTKLWLCTAATDMRKSYDGLVALAKNHLGRDPLNGHGFIFVNRRCTQMKLLYFDGDGFCIWSKRLEQGQFGVRHERQAESVELSRTEFEGLLEGLDLEIRNRRKRWQFPYPPAA